MAQKLHTSSSECCVSALDLFYVPPTQTSVEKGTWVHVHPKASVSDTGPIEFEFEGKQQEFLDLAHTLLYVTVQLVKSDGSETDSPNAYLGITSALKGNTAIQSNQTCNHKKLQYFSRIYVKKCGSSVS